MDRGAGSGQPEARSRVADYLLNSFKDPTMNRFYFHPCLSVFIHVHPPRFGPQRIFRLRMRCVVPAMLSLLIASFLAPDWSCFAQQARPLPIYPQGKLAVPLASENERAYKLYELARRENPLLRWDGCLATQAFMRAKRMAADHYFNHKDPKTGKNPVWNLVRLCVPAGHAGFRAHAAENLAKGIDTPENIHRALMESPAHRKNILDRHFNHIGVGCSDDICVELFTGY